MQKPFTIDKSKSTRENFDGLCLFVKGLLIYAEPLAQLRALLARKDVKKLIKDTHYGSFRLRGLLQEIFQTEQNKEEGRRDNVVKAIAIVLQKKPFLNPNANSIDAKKGLRLLRRKNKLFDCIDKKPNGAGLYLTAMPFSDDIAGEEAFKNGGLIVSVQIPDEPFAADGKLLEMKGSGKVVTGSNRQVNINGRMVSFTRNNDVPLFDHTVTDSATGKTVTKGKTMKLLDDMDVELKKGKPVILHCWGGAARSAAVAMLAECYSFGRRLVGAMDNVNTIRPKTRTFADMREPMQHFMVTTYFHMLATKPELLKGFLKAHTGETDEVRNTAVLKELQLFATHLMGSECTKQDADNFCKVANAAMTMDSSISKEALINPFKEMKPTKKGRSPKERNFPETILAYISLHIGAVVPVVAAVTQTNQTKPNPVNQVTVSTTSTNTSTAEISSRLIASSSVVTATPVTTVNSAVNLVNQANPQPNRTNVESANPQAKDNPPNERAVFLADLIGRMQGNGRNGQGNDNVPNNVPGFVASRPVTTADGCDLVLMSSMPDVMPSSQKQAYIFAGNSMGYWDGRKITPIPITTANLSELKQKLGITLSSELNKPGALNEEQLKHVTLISGHTPADNKQSEIKTAVFSPIKPTNNKGAKGKGDFDHEGIREKILSYQTWLNKQSDSDKPSVLLIPVAIGSNNSKHWVYVKMEFGKDAEGDFKPQSATIIDSRMFWSARSTKKDFGAVSRDIIQQFGFEFNTHVGVRTKYLATQRLRDYKNSAQYVVLGIEQCLKNGNEHKHTLTSFFSPNKISEKAKRSIPQEDVSFQRDSPFSKKVENVQVENVQVENVQVENVQVENVRPRSASCPELPVRQRERPVRKHEEECLPASEALSLSRMMR